MPIFTFTTLDDPLAINGTFATGINASGQVVGSYNDAGGTAHGFLLSGGTYTTFNDPDANGGDTLADGINNLGQIVGTFINFPVQELAYIKIGNSYPFIVYPLNVNFVTEAHGINSLGEVVGEYTDNAGAIHGFVYLRDLGVFATFAPNDASFPNTVLNGINENGTLMVGQHGGRGVPEGFLWNGVFFTPLRDPFAGNNGTNAKGVNDSGQVVGYYFDASNRAHGFLYSNGNYTTIDVGARGTFLNGINDAGQIVGTYIDITGHDHGFVGSFQPNPTPSGGTTAAMVLRGANSSAAVAGQYEIYDIGNNAILAAYLLGQVGTDYQFAGLGRFFDGDTVDMILRNTGTGGLEVYDINNNQLTNAASVGMVGLDWQIIGTGNFSSVPGETDMMMRNTKTGGLEVYDIANNQITGAAFLGTVGLDWQFAGIAPVHAAGASDLVLRNVNTGAFEVYDIANNQITGAAPLGSVGLDWQLGGFAADPPTGSMGSAGSTSQLVQEMAGFGGGGAADTSNSAPLEMETSQQPLLTTSYA
jgi:probable HAF family extracellular repeat protein